MELKGLFAPSCAGQLQSLMAGVGAVVAWPRLIGADDVVEVAKQLKQSGAGSLGEFMFRGEQLEKYRQRGSVLIPHELLRWEGRYERDAKCSNDIRAGGTTNKEAPLWAPSGKNLTTPENYIELARLVQPDLVQLMNDYDFDRTKPNTKKRYEKAKKRSETWIDKQLTLLDDKCNVLLPVSVFSDEYHQKFHLEFIAQKIAANKESIQGLSLNGETRQDVNVDYLALIKKYAAELSHFKLPLYCFDLSTPKQILAGRRFGIEGFGGQYGLIEAQRHCAIVLPNAQYPRRRFATIDMRDKERLRMNTDRLTADSPVTVSIGYIAHLAKVGEILEMILLAQHNLDQMERFVAFITAKDTDLTAVEALLE